MTLDEVLLSENIIELKSRDKAIAIMELAAVLGNRHPALDTKQVAARIQDKEALFSSVIRDGVALPHIHIPMEAPILIAIGRSHKGVDFLGDGRQLVHLVVLLITRPDLPEAHLEVLRELALLFDNEKTLLALKEAPNTADLKRLLIGKKSHPGIGHQRRHSIDETITDLLIEHSAHIARELGIKTIFINCDSLQSIDKLSVLQGNDSQSRLRVIPVFKKNKAPEEFQKAYPDFLQLPEIDLARAGQIKLALFLALGKKWINRNDILIYLLPGEAIQGVSNIDVVAIRKRFTDLVFIQPENFRLALDPLVLQQIIKIAFDLAINGREGRPVGTLFVAGDHQAVLPHTQQLIVNPFRVARDGEHYNILDLALEEMIKEFAQIDGAFILARNGSILSAGAYVGTGRRKAEITKGLGARHQAAANITTVTKAIAITVSETNGMISVFQDGHTVFTIDPVMRNLRIREGSTTS
ncbi:MAG: diadenylate cyclase [Spirochaetota bacterium]|jgi:DNA integrity scanning protein DisA with diadenylate cyclase activity/mannitol/fructose-specific phosphotransferase system IIA component (Ntr-type)|nr:diadenylate cyclase [Spirochaetota bacterium]